MRQVTPFHPPAYPSSSLPNAVPAAPVRGAQRTTGEQADTGIHLIKRSNELSYCTLAVFRQVYYLRRATNRAFILWYVAREKTLTAQHVLN